MLRWTVRHLLESDDPLISLLLSRFNDKHALRFSPCPPFDVWISTSADSPQERMEVKEAGEIMAAGNTNHVATFPPTYSHIHYFALIK